MLIRPGECQECKAQYHLPVEFTELLVRCRLCPGAVRVGEPTDVPDQPAGGAKGAERSQRAKAPAGAAPTLGAAAAQLASATLASAEAAGERAVDAVFDAVRATEESAAGATAGAFGISGDIDSTAARSLAASAAVEADVARIEEELELLDLDEFDEHEPAAAPSPTTTNTPARSGSSAGWSPAALERSPATREDAASKPAGKDATLEPAPRRGGTLERLRAERAAQGQTAPVAATPVEKPRVSTLERLKAERNAAPTAASTPAPSTPTSGDRPMSTLERLKAQRGAAATSAAPAPSPAPALAPKEREKKRDRDREREPRTLAYSKEETRKRNARNLLIGLGLLVVAGAVVGIAWKQGFFEQEKPVAPAASTNTGTTPAPLATPAPIGLSPFDRMPLAPAPTDGAAPADAAPATSEEPTGKTLEEEAREKLGGDPSDG